MPEFNYDQALADLQWQPIADYDRAQGEVVAARAEGWLDPAFYGDRTGWGSLTAAERGADRRECWRSAQESDDALPLSYKPVEFAALTPALRKAITAD